MPGEVTHSGLLTPYPVLYFYLARLLCLEDALNVWPNTTVLLLKHSMFSENRNLSTAYLIKSMRTQLSLKKKKKISFGSNKDCHGP